MIPKTPLLTVDALIIYPDDSIVLIERKNRPHGWAIPGGFVDIGETVENAVKREAKEETGIDIEDVKLLGVYSDPKRDERGHTVSIVYTSAPKDPSKPPVAGDDAGKAKLFSLNDLPEKIAFDHRQIILDYLGLKNEEV